MKCELRTHWVTVLFYASPFFFAIYAIFRGRTAPSRLNRPAAAITLCILAAGCATHRLSLDGREEWAAQCITELRAFEPAADTPAAAVEVDGVVAIVRAHEGLIRLQEGEWVLFKSCSSHDPSLADVVLAIDHRGRIYGVNGHVCPHLVLMLPKGGTLHSADDFFATRVEDSNQGWRMRRWRRMPVEEEREVGACKGD